MNREEKENMVTENVEQPAESTEALAGPSPGTTEPVLNTDETVDTVQPEMPLEPTEDSNTAALPDTDPVPEQSVPEQQTTPEAMPPPAPAQQYTPEQIADLQKQNQQYQQYQRSLAMQQEAEKYRIELERQGYLPEQAQTQAQERVRVQQELEHTKDMAQRYGEFLSGRQSFAEKIAEQYKLNIVDLNELRKYNDPQSMEAAAKTLSYNRQRDAELSALKQSRVPPQQVDNSQGSPEVAADEGSWLDRYNNGDRTANAVAAARRAAGLQ